MAKETLISGIKSTGTLHIGNYFGAMRQFVELQNDYECFVFVADLHALTTLQNAEKMRETITETVAGYIAVGLDPKKVTLYKQSDVPQVAELAWIFNCLTTMPYLMRAHAFKDAEAKNKEINVGIFDYPMLMAADILIQKANIVPVGLDQKQHIEITRDTALKFNRIFGDVFALPKERIQEEMQTIVGTDGEKMSKSRGNIIPLFAGDEEIDRLVRGIATDSKGIDEPKDTENNVLFSYHKLFSVKDLPELKKRYEKGGIGYKESKDILIKNMIEMLSPMREKYLNLMKDKKAIIEILDDGGQRARERAEETIMEVRKKVGVIL